MAPLVQLTKYRKRFAYRFADVTTMLFPPVLSLVDPSLLSRLIHRPL